MVDSELNPAERMHSSHLDTAHRPLRGVSCAAAKVHRAWCSEMETSPNES